MAGMVPAVPHLVLCNQEDQSQSSLGLTWGQTCSPRQREAARRFWYLLGQCPSQLDHLALPPRCGGSQERCSGELTQPLRFKHPFSQVRARHESQISDTDFKCLKTHDSQLKVQGRHIATRCSCFQHDSRSLETTVATGPTWKGWCGLQHPFWEVIQAGWNQCLKASG